LSEGQYVINRRRQPAVVRPSKALPVGQHNTFNTSTTFSVSLFADFIVSPLRARELGVFLPQDKSYG